MPEGTCECRRLATFILVGPVYHNALTNCAALVSPGGPSLALRAIQLVPRLRRVNRMCSSTVSVNCEKAEEVMQEQPDCRSLFQSGRRSLVCARPSKGKGRYTRGWKPQVSTLLCARAASAHISFASQAAVIYNRNRRRKNT